MPRPPESPFALLGVAPTAELGDIRRAYRRAVVRVHRSGVLDIVDALDVLKRAYEMLQDPAARERFTARARTADLPPRSWARPESHEAHVRSRMQREVRRQSLRTTADAHQQNRETVRELADEHERRERRLARRLLRERRWAGLVRAVCLALLAAGLVELALHLSWK